MSASMTARRSSIPADSHQAVTSSVVPWRPARTLLLRSEASSLVTASRSALTRAVMMPSCFALIVPSA
jgi:hypothetical protein